MKKTIGLTYDLRDDYLALGYSEEETAEFDQPQTIDAIEDVLLSLGFKTERIGNVYSLLKRLSNSARWDLVFNIAEGLYGIGREAQIPAILDAYRIPYTFSDPLVCALTLHKGMTKHIVRDMGIPTPEFYLLEKITDIDSVNIRYPLFVKPVAEGTSKGIGANSKVNDRSELLSICSKLLKDFKQPVLIERFLPGREMTVGILGTGCDANVISVMEINLLANAEADVYSYSNKEEYEDRVRYSLINDKLADIINEYALRIWQGLGCKDAGRMDFRLDENNIPNFLEVNPLAGLNPKRSDLPIMCALAGMSYKEIISKIIDSALRRIIIIK